jgi:hypothetical protein
MFAPPSPVKEEKEKVRNVLVGTLSLFMFQLSSQASRYPNPPFWDKIFNNSPTKLW